MIMLSFAWVIVDFQGFRCVTFILRVQSSLFLVLIILRLKFGQGLSTTYQEISSIQSQRSLICHLYYSDCQPSRPHQA